MVKSVRSSWPLTSVETVDSESAKRKHTKEIAELQQFIRLILKVLKFAGNLGTKACAVLSDSKVKHNALWPWLPPRLILLELLTDQTTHSLTVIKVIRNRLRGFGSDVLLELWRVVSLFFFHGVTSRKREMRMWKWRQWWMPQVWTPATTANPDSDV